MRKKKKISKKGTYNGDMIKTSPPSWRIGSAQRDKRDRENFPGPGDYEPTYKLSRPRTANHK